MIWQLFFSFFFYWRLFKYSIQISSRIAYTFLLFLLLAGCQKENKLSSYIENIPPNEEINASLYNYELIVAEMQKHHNQNKPYEVLQEYENYLEVFYESSILDESELLYLTGISLKKIFSSFPNPSFDMGFFSYIKENKKRKNFLGVEWEGKYLSNKGGEKFPNNMRYNHYHFFKILEDRNHYELEKQTLLEMYDLKLAPVNSKTEHRNNFKHLYWLVTRYPDLFSPQNYQDIITQYIRSKWLSSKERQRLNRIKKILSIMEEIKQPDLIKATNQKNSTTWRLPISNQIVVYNRTDWVSSRNLTSLSLWEPFQVLAQVNGEDGQIWYSILFRNHRLGFIDSYSFKESRAFNQQDTIEITSYVRSYQDLQEKNFISGVERLSELLINMEIQSFQDPTSKNSFLLERIWYLFHHLLTEIAARSTSLHNPYTDFTLQYSDYFEVSSDQINLEVNDYFLKKIILLHPSSPMLQYFGGFNSNQ